MKSLGNRVANGGTPTIQHNSVKESFVFGVAGTAGVFGTADIEFRQKGETAWIVAPNAQLTAVASSKVVNLPRECEIHVNLAGSTTPNLDFWLG